ncbi:MAG TPA: DUF6655 family protein [Pirellulales bacterium]|jgi:hypothetical protein|nr:DUF6655 family protein [Pirellulales bacterium]
MPELLSIDAAPRAVGRANSFGAGLFWALGGAFALLGGCATIKESDTPRTGIEQLLISSAVDRALDKIDFKPVHGTKVYVEPKHLDCVDKEYILVALHHRLLAQNCTLCEKPEDADVQMEISSGGVGTDRQDLFIGIPEIPLAPPSPIAIPKLSLLNRSKSMGTAKLLVVAFDSKSKQPVMNSGYALARSDFKNLTVLAGGGVQSGSVERELVAATGQRSSTVGLPQSFAARDSSSVVK